MVVFLWSEFVLLVIAHSKNPSFELLYSTSGSCASQHPEFAIYVNVNVLITTIVLDLLHSYGHVHHLPNNLNICAILRGLDIHIDLRSVACFSLIQRFKELLVTNFFALWLNRVVHSKYWNTFILDRLVVRSFVSYLATAIAPRELTFFHTGLLVLSNQWNGQNQTLLGHKPTATLFKCYLSSCCSF